MKDIKSRLLAGVLAFILLGQLFAMPVYAEQTNIGNSETTDNTEKSPVIEPEMTEDAENSSAIETGSTGNAENCSVIETEMTEDAEKSPAIETGTRENTDENSDTKEETAGSTGDGEDSESEESEISESDSGTQNTESEISEDSNDSDIEDEAGMNGKLKLRLFAAEETAGPAVLETGKEFSADIEELSENSAEIKGIVLTAEAPTGSYVDVGERHHHTSACYTTVQIDRSFDSLTPLGAVYESDGAVTCGCGSGGHKVNYVATIHEVKTVNGVVVSDEHLSSQSNTGCGNCISKNYGIGTQYYSELICDKSESVHTSHIYAYLQDDMLYLYNAQAPGEDLTFNADEAGMFATMTGIKSLDLTSFDGSALTDTTNMFPAELEALTMNSSFRFSNSSGTYATSGSGLTDAWEKDGEEIYDGDTPAPFKTQKTYNTSLLSGTFEGRWNSNAESFAGTWVRNSETHSYVARGQAATTPGGNAWEEHNPDKRFYGYCFAQHLASPNGKYDKILVDDMNILLEILNGQNYQTAPAADNIRDAIVTILYYGFPNNKAGIQQKYGLSDAQFSAVTWHVLCHYSDGMSRRGGFSGAAGSAYDELYNQTYDSIPDALKANLHLYIYVSEQHQQHMVAIDGVNYENYGGVSVGKEDAYTGMPLTGAEFTIYDENGNAVDTNKETAAIDPIVSGSDGKAYICRCDKVQGLPMGTYTIRETKAPTGYDLPDYYYTFTVAHNGLITLTGTNSKTGVKEKMIFRDEPTVDYHAGGIKIRKTNEEDESQGLIGAVYGIYAASDVTASSKDGNRIVTLYATDEKVTELTTGLDGYVSTGISALPFGSYYLKEITPPVGFIKNDSVTEFEVSEENQLQSNVITLTDTPKRVDAELVFRKEILSSGHRLKAGQFTYDLYRVEFSGDASGKSNKRILVGTTTNDAAGKIVFNSENTNGALSFSETKDLGHANFVCVERPNPGNRYNYDTHEEFVELSLSDDGVSKELIATPMYGADISNLKTVPIYATDELIEKNYHPGMFRNCYRQPSDLPDPTKEVSGGTTITEKLHNKVRYGDTFTYDVFQTIPEEDETDYFKSFVFYDELPRGICLNSGDNKEYAFSISADGLDVTDSFNVSVDRQESTRADEESPVYIVTAAYRGDLKDAAAYGATYDFHMEVTAAEEVTEPKTYTNFAKIDIVYSDDENHYILDDNGDVLKDGNGKAFYEAEAEYKLPESPSEYAGERTTDPLKAVHSCITNPVETDVYPYIPDTGWTAAKHVYNTEGEEINTFAVRHEDLLTYKICIQNKMEFTGGLVTVTDPIPDNVSFVDSDPRAVFDEAAGLITWEDQHVGPGETVTLSFRVHVKDGTSIAAIDNKAHGVMRADWYKAELTDPMLLLSEKDTKNMHNYVPSISKMVTDENGKNMNGLLVDEGEELTYHIYVTNPDTAGDDPKRSGKHTFTIRDKVPLHTELIGDEKATEVSWTAEFETGETKEFIFKVRTVGRGVTIENAADLLVTNIPYSGPEEEPEEESGEEAGKDGTSVESFHSNEVVNGVPMDPLKSVTTLEGKDVNQKFLSVDKTYRYTITFNNPTQKAKTYTIKDKVPDHIVVENIETGEPAAGGETAAEPGTYSYIDGILTFVIKAAPEEESHVSFTFRPTDKDAYFSNQGKVTIGDNYPVEPFTGIVDRSGEDHILKRSTNIVENWTPADPVKTVSGSVTSGTAADKDGKLVFGENEDTLLYTIRFRNTSNLKKTFTVTDLLDEDLTFISATDDGRYDSDTGTVIWTMPLEAGKEKEVTFKAKVSAGNKAGSADNTAVVNVDDAHPSTNETKTGIDTTPVKTVTDGEGNNIDDFLVNKGDRLTYYIDVFNPMAVTKRFKVTDDVPENTEFISAEQGETTSSSHKTNSSDVNTVTVSAAGTSIVWEADIPAGETYRFCFKVKAVKKGAYIPNDALVSVDGSRIRTNLVENWTPEDPLKAVTKNGADADGQTFTMGDETELSYEIVVRNPANKAKTFAVKDVLDGNLVFVSADNGGSVNNNTVTWNVEVGAEQEKKVTVNVRIIASPYKTEIKNKATITCDLFSAETNTVTVYLKRAKYTASPETKETPKAVITSAESEDIAVYSGPGTGDAGTGKLMLSLSACITSILLLLLLLKRRRERKES